MKKAVLHSLWILLLCVFLFAGCGRKEPEPEPVYPIDESYYDEIRALGQLATLECYYHNVARSEKEAGTGLSHLFEKDRKFWIEYVGIAKVGVDMEQIVIEPDGDTIRITLPEAQVLSIEVDESSLDESSFYSSEDGILNKNAITAEDQTAAIADAQETMQKAVEENKALMRNARELAKKIIGNYISEVGEAAGVTYTIIWMEPGAPAGTEKG
ncbi:MAG: DUF4230 domain-containing protein [Lachnospiraceae bacterium]|nr:DUF4230 domain-containing protein [Lachnospiraceae bacterium]